MEKEYAPVRKMFRLFCKLAKIVSERRELKTNRCAGFLCAGTETDKNHQSF